MSMFSTRRFLLVSSLLCAILVLLAIVTSAHRRQHDDNDESDAALEHTLRALSLRSSLTNLHQKEKCSTRRRSVFMFPDEARAVRRATPRAAPTRMRVRPGTYQRNGKKKSSSDGLTRTLLCRPDHRCVYRGRMTFNDNVDMHMSKREKRLSKCGDRNVVAVWSARYEGPAPSSFGAGHVFSVRFFEAWVYAQCRIDPVSTTRTRAELRMYPLYVLQDLSGKIEIMYQNKKETTNAMVVKRTFVNAINARLPSTSASPVATTAVQLTAEAPLALTFVDTESSSHPLLRHMRAWTDAADQSLTHVDILSFASVRSGLKMKSRKPTTTVNPKVQATSRMRCKAVIRDGIVISFNDRSKVEFGNGDAQAVQSRKFPSSRPIATSGKHDAEMAAAVAGNAPPKLETKSRINVQVKLTSIVRHHRAGPERVAETFAELAGDADERLEFESLDDFYTRRLSHREASLLAFPSAPPSVAHYLVESACHGQLRPIDVAHKLQEYTHSDDFVESLSELVDQVRESCMADGLDAILTGMGGHNTPVAQRYLVQLAAQYPAGHRIRDSALLALVHSDDSFDDGMEHHTDDTVQALMQLHDDDGDDQSLLVLAGVLGNLRATGRGDAYESLIAELEQHLEPLSYVDGDHRKLDRATLILAALGNAAFPRSIPAIAAFAQAPSDVHVQSFAARTLAEFADSPDARQVLVEIATDESVHAHVRGTCIDLLSQIDDLSVEQTQSVDAAALGLAGDGEDGGEGDDDVGDDEDKVSAADESASPALAQVGGSVFGHDEHDDGDAEDDGDNGGDVDDINDDDKDDDKDDDDNNNNGEAARDDAENDVVDGDANDDDDEEEGGTDDATAPADTADVMPNSDDYVVSGGSGSDVLPLNRPIEGSLPAEDLPRPPADVAEDDEKKSTASQKKKGRKDRRRAKQRKLKRQKRSSELPKAMAQRHVTEEAQDRARHKLQEKALKMRNLADEKRKARQWYNQLKKAPHVRNRAEVLRRRMNALERRHSKSERKLRARNVASEMLHKKRHQLQEKMVAARRGLRKLGSQRISKLRRTLSKNPVQTLKRLGSSPTKALRRLKKLGASPTRSGKQLKTLARKRLRRMTRKTRTAPPAPTAAGTRVGSGEWKWERRYESKKFGKAFISGRFEAGVGIVAKAYEQTQSMEVSGEAYLRTPIKVWMLKARVFDVGAVARWPHLGGSRTLRIFVKVLGKQIWGKTHSSSARGIRLARESCPLGAPLSRDDLIKEHSKAKGKSVVFPIPVIPPLLTVIVRITLTGTIRLGLFLAPYGCLPPAVTAAAEPSIGLKLTVQGAASVVVAEGGVGAEVELINAAVPLIMRARLNGQYCLRADFVLTAGGGRVFVYWRMKLPEKLPFADALEAVQVEDTDSSSSQQLASSSSSSSSAVLALPPAQLPSPTPQESLLDASALEALRGAEVMSTLVSHLEAFSSLPDDAHVDGQQLVHWSRRWNRAVDHVSRFMTLLEASGHRFHEEDDGDATDDGGDDATKEGEEGDEEDEEQDEDDEDRVAVLAERRRGRWRPRPSPIFRRIVHPPMPPWRPPPWRPPVWRPPALPFARRGGRRFGRAASFAKKALKAGALVKGFKAFGAKKLLKGIGKRLGRKFGRGLKKFGRGLGRRVKRAGLKRFGRGLGRGLKRFGRGLGRGLKKAGKFAAKVAKKYVQARLKHFKTMLNVVTLPMRLTNKFLNRLAGRKEKTIFRWSGLRKTYNAFKKPQNGCQE